MYRWHHRITKEVRRLLPFNSHLRLCHDHAAMCLWRRQCGDVTSGRAPNSKWHVVYNRKLRILRPTNKPMNIVSTYDCPTRDLPTNLTLGKTTHFSTYRSSVQQIAMLLDDSPANLLQATLQNFTTQPDKLAVSRVNDSLSTLAQSRSLRIHDAETALRKLSRQLNTISSQHKQTLSEHDATSHAREVVELDSKKFRVAKGVSDLEQEGERLQSELTRLKTRLAELEEQGVEGDVQARRARQADDPTV